MQHVRCYTSTDYESVIALYKKGDLFGGQFDEARDSREKLAEVTKRDSESILIYECDGKILGTISLIENGRVAWLFRFAVIEMQQDHEISKALYRHASYILKARGHDQILVYSDPNNENLNTRYVEIGMSAGNLYRCFWEEI